MGAVFVDEKIHAAFMQGPQGAIEFFHGYTYSGHPVACAAALATLDIYRRDDLFQRAVELEGYWQDALFSLRDLPNVVDIRAVGLVGGVQLAPHADGPGKRGYDVFERCFWEHDLMVRVTGDIIAMSPPLIIDKPHIDQIVERLAQAIRASVDPGGWRRPASNWPEPQEPRVSMNIEQIVDFAQANSARSTTARRRRKSSRATRNRACATTTAAPAGSSTPVSGKAPWASGR